MLKIFNWKKHPISVFYLAFPLVIIGIGLNLLFAILQFTINHNPAYLIIFIIMMPLMSLPIILIIRNRKILAKALQDFEKDQ